MRFSIEPRTDAKRDARSVATVIGGLCLFVGEVVGRHGDKLLKHDMT